MTLSHSRTLRAGLAASALILCLAPGCRRSQTAPAAQEYQAAPVTRPAEPIRREAAPVRRQNTLSHASRQGRSETVYVTESGRKYHRSGCTYLKKSRQSISRDEAQHAGFSACSVCRP